MTLHEPSWGDARLAAFRAGGVRASEDRALVDAVGLTLAMPLVARASVPGFDTAMMDGWAVSGSGPWTISGRVLAGSAPSALDPGTAVVIATGAAVPLGASGVLRREWGVVTGSQLQTDRALERGQDIRVAGDEARVGDVLLEAGAPVTPPVIGLAALVGLDTLHVYQPACIEVLVLGDEIVTAGVPPAGTVRDALGLQLARWTAQFGCIDLGVRYVADTLEATINAIRTSEADVVFTTGGTARGPVDHMHDALEALDAELVIDEVRVRPGHPMLLARLADARFLIGLPGNPLAAIAGYLALGLPLLSAMAGRPLPVLDRCVTTHPITAPGSDRRLMPASRRGSYATPTEFWGSAMLRGIAQSDCLLVSEPGGSAAGIEVEFLPLPW